MFKFCQARAMKRETRAMRKETKVARQGFVVLSKNERLKRPEISYLGQMNSYERFGCHVMQSFILWGTNKYFLLLSHVM